MPLIQMGIGAIGQKKDKPKAEAPAEGGGGGDAGPAGPAGGAEGAKGAGGAEGAQAAQQNKEAEVDRFIQMLNSPNIRSIGDIKNFRDQVLQKMQGSGLDAGQMDNAKKKLNQAILQKLGIGKPGPNGAMAVDMTPQNQQILQQLGMQPDQVTPAGGAAAGGAAGPGGALQPGIPGAAQPGAPANPAGGAPQIGPAG